jgi:hypothetical protein
MPGSENMSNLNVGSSDWIDSIIDKLERLLKILRGLPHNRLALITVSAGAVVVSGPFWEPYLRAAAEKYLEIKISLPIEPSYGIGIIGLGLVYHFLMALLASRENISIRSLEQQSIDKIIAHDLPIFQAFVNGVPENAFKNAMSSILNDHSYTSEQSAMFRGGYYFLDTVSNEFNDNALQTNATELKNAIDVLSSFLSTHFFVYGPLLKGDIIRFCLDPQLNIDRGGLYDPDNNRKYAELSDQLSPLVDAAVAAYDRLLRACQKRLL